LEIQMKIKLVTKENVFADMHLISSFRA